MGLSFYLSADNVTESGLKIVEVAVHVLKITIELPGVDVKR